MIVVACSMLRDLEGEGMVEEGRERERGRERFPQ